MEKISIIVSCYNEEESIPLFYQEITKVWQDQMTTIDYELLFIDDGSHDNTKALLQALCAKDSHCHYYSFSRNFGKEAAIFAGFKNCSGDYAVLMDADLQDPPSLLPEMFRIVKEEGYDSVATRRSNRDGESKIRSFFARCFYKIINRISNTEIVDGARDYRLMKRSMVDAILSMCEYNRFSKGIFGWIGFETKWISYENVERVAGDTKWSFFSLLSYSLDGIIGFSTMPLSIASLFGFLFCFISIILIIFIIARTLIWGDPVSGWPSTICIIFFIGGIQMSCIGILGQYLAKTYLETKRRPAYIIKESNDGKST